MQDRMNSMEAALLVALNTESDITDEFNLIEIGVPDAERRFQKHEFPTLLFECLECSDTPPEVDSHDIVYERLHFVAIIVYQHAERDECREKIKKLISLVRDFLHSDSWTQLYRQETIVGRSAFDIAKSEMTFKSAASIEFTVDVQVG